METGGAEAESPVCDLRVGWIRVLSLGLESQVGFVWGRVGGDDFKWGRAMVCYRRPRGGDPKETGNWGPDLEGEVMPACHRHRVIAEAGTVAEIMGSPAGTPGV